VPAAGKIKLDFSLCDYMVLSAHKIGGPQGSGHLLRREARRCSRNGGRRPAKGPARRARESFRHCRLWRRCPRLADGEGERARIAHLRDHFETALKQAVPETVIFGMKQDRLCSTPARHSRALTAEIRAAIGLDLDGVRPH
jgi:cysteine desulfurase